MKTLTSTCVLLLMLTLGAEAQRTSPDTIPAEAGEVTVHPVRHGSLVLQWNGHAVYVDPVGGAALYEGLPRPDLVLITHPHGDHMDLATLRALNDKNPVIIAPKVVGQELPSDFEGQVVVLPNGSDTNRSAAGDMPDIPVNVRSVPMYNLPDGPDARHPKGWGNGYLVELGGKVFYVSGDTEDIPEMRSLEGVDVAFVCMNMPYTMDVNQAADAVLEFQPAIVYPYHYRGQNIARFKELVDAGGTAVEVRLKEWYPGN
ncbi:MAG: MBL fold metallo-hydrolase [Balneolaceae bacterium]|nr:MBL fold metallo-hydrolase [Balneolaceae bacterium]